MYSYETLQAGASILVSKPCNSHPPYWVTFENKLFPCFFPKYKGLPDLRKYFIVFFCVLSTELRLNFWGGVYPNFEPFLQLKYMKIHIKACPQNCRYAKYLSFATSVILVTVLGSVQFAFLCKVNFDKLPLHKFWAWVETKTDFLRQNQAKIPDNFQVLWIFHIFTENSHKPWLRVGPR